MGVICLHGSAEEGARDPVTGRRRQTTRTYGTLREAKLARAESLVEASHGQHDGTNATVGVA